MNRLSALKFAVRFELNRLRRDFITMFFALAFPVMLLVIFGSVYGNAPNKFLGNIGTVDATVPAYIVVVVAVTGLMSFPLSMTEYRERGVLKRMSLTPLQPFSLLVGQFVVNALLTLAAIGALILTGILGFGISVDPSWRFYVGLLMTIWSLYGIGIFVASVAPNQRTATLIANLLYFPMIFLTGASIPFGLLPRAMQSVGKLLPMYYAVEWTRAGWNPGTPGATLASALILIVTGGIGVLAGLRFFRW